MTHSIGFNAIAGASPHILILGSLPGTESLKHRQYYALKANSFWKIMAILLNIPGDCAYPDRLRLLEQNHIALWDVCASGYREGSLDSKIDVASVRPNNFLSFFRKHSTIKHIFFNGQPAAKLYEKLVLKELSSALGAMPRTILPSTSPAHARMPFTDKLNHWSNALDPFLKLPSERSNRLKGR